MNRARRGGCSELAGAFKNPQRGSDRLAIPSRGYACQARSVDIVAGTEAGVMGPSRGQPVSKGSSLTVRATLPSRLLAQ